jgi:pyruvate formate lyase activating enzyme
MDRNADIILRLPMIPDCNDSDEDIKLLSRFINENKGRYRYVEVMPYHTLGTGKSEKIGTDISYIHDNASEKDIPRWVSLFNSHGIDVKVSK